jgi:PIN domain nuclease of toxin-antitoxin system
MSFGDKKLSRRYRTLLFKSDVQLCLSPISIWEAQMLSSLGRIELLPTSSQWIKRSIDQLNISEVQIDWRVALEVERLDWQHRDPADRFLVATARTNNLKLATQDKEISAFSGVEIA